MPVPNLRKLADIRLPRLPRPHPLALLLGVLGVLGGVSAIEESAGSRQADLLEAKGAYVAALASTRTELGSLLARVATDKTLSQNLNWRLSHSVQSTLLGRLQKGSLDQLALVDDGCREIARARLGGAPSVPCPFESAGGKRDTDSFQWLTGEPYPVLLLTRQVAGVSGAEIFAVGAVALDGDWLARHQDLRGYVSKLDLTIGVAPPSATTLVSEGATADGKMAAALSSSDRLDRYLLGNKRGPRQLGSELFGPCLLLAAGLAIWALARERQRRRVAQERVESLVAWSQRLTPGGQVEIPGRERGHAPDAAQSLSAVQRYVTAALKHKSDEMRLVSTRLAAAKEELRGKDAEIKKHKRRLAELAELDSLAVQLGRTTQAFLERMETLREDTQDLLGLTGEGLRPCARLLTETLAAWQAGVRERGARKFLRGLAETPGTAAGGTAETTRLDEDLALLRTLATELDDQALASTVRAKGLLDVADFATKLAGLWHGIALKTHADKAATSLAQPMEDAQGLVKIEAPTADFLNSLDEAEARDIPPLPRTVWVTALYHVYLAMAELARGHGATVATRIRKEDDKTMLVVQCVAKDGRPLPRRSDAEAYHLDVARSILSPFPVTLTALPSLGGPFPIAMAWTSPNEKRPDGRRGASKLPESRERSASL